MGRMLAEFYRLPTSWMILAVAGAFVLMLIITIWQNRRYLAQSERKQCRECGNLFPASAKFCGHCGRKF